MPTLHINWYFEDHHYCVGMARRMCSLESMDSSYKTPAFSRNTRTSGQLRLIGAG
jgi:hypothetical protein